VSVLARRDAGETAYLFWRKTPGLADIWPDPQVFFRQARFGVDISI